MGEGERGGAVPWSYPISSSVLASLQLQGQVTGNGEVAARVGEETVGL